MGIYTASKPTVGNPSGRIRIDIDTGNEYIAIRGIDTDMNIHFTTLAWIVDQLNIANGYERLNTEPPPELAWTNFTGEKQ